MQSTERLAAAALDPTSAPLVTRILSLDDGVIDQMMCKRVINRSGIAQEVVCCATPTSALEYLGRPESPAIDLILLDVNMPYMNGFEFLVAAQEQATNGTVPPVLVMLSTPLGPIHAKQAATLDVINGYLDKPLDGNALKDAILLMQAPPAPPCPKLRAL